MADSTYNDSGGTQNGYVTGYPHDGSYHAASASARQVGPDMLPDPDPRLSGAGSAWGDGR